MSLNHINGNTICLLHGTKWIIQTRSLINRATEYNKTDTVIGRYAEINVVCSKATLRG
jgi:hypothetical protein